MKPWIFLTVAILTTIVPPKTKTTEKMVFLVDKSGSMSADNTADAIDKFVEIAMSADPSLDVEICMYSFETNTKRWKYGWQKLPSADVLEAARKFLNEKTATGSTSVVPAIRRALFEHKKKLTVIIITDGQFDEKTEDIIKVIRTQQVNRVIRGKPMAVIGCIGVGASQEDSLKAIAKEGNGGYYHAVRERTKDEAH